MEDKLMIKMLREEQGITQQELANKLNMNRSLLSHLETGKVLPPMSTLIKIARILNCIVTDLYRKEDLNIIKTSTSHNNTRRTGGSMGEPIPGNKNDNSQ